MQQHVGMVLLDGPDGAGKSFLAEALSRRVAGNSHVRHMTYRWKLPPGNKRQPTMWHYHTAALHRAANGSSDRLEIMDRGWPSEIVYASVYRQGSLWPMMGRMMDRIVLKQAGVYVFCLMAPGRAGQEHARLKAQRDEMYSGGMDEVASGYANLYRSLGERSDVVLYDREVEGRNIDAFCDLVLNRLAARRSSQYKLALDGHFHNFTGHISDAEVLLVGDRCNPKFRSIRWPFYDHDSNGCSLFLTEQLVKLGVHDHKVIMVNSRGCIGERVLSDVLSLKPGLNVIALGNDASAALSSLGIGHTKIPHPQHSRRFNRASGYPELSEALSGCRK